MNTDYDRLPYTDHAYAESHPDRLAVVARLARWTPPEIERARVLEIGCGRGGNLLPMASSLPNASFVGVDSSSAQIAEATLIATASGLSNVTFEAASFEQSTSARGEFDFVIAHGLCSWITPDARRALFRRIASSLAHNGVAYVSFNVLPGWYGKLAARDWLIAFGDPNDARSSLAWLAEQTSPEHVAYRRQLEDVRARIAETDPRYVAHEFFAREHHPQRITEFLDEAGAAGLRFLGDAIPQTNAIELLSAGARDRARTLDCARAQELIDFVQCTAFRRALLVRSDTCEKIHRTWSHTLDASAFARPRDGLRIASRLVPTEDDDRFDAPDVSVQITDAHTREALHALANASPRSLAGETFSKAELFDLWLATGAIDLHVFEPSIADARASHPRACPIARWHAERGGPITNRWHHEVAMPDATLRAVLALLDGTRTASEIASELAIDPALAVASLDELARVALLV